MRFAVVPRAPDDTLTVGSLLVWLDAVLRAEGPDLPLALRTPEGVMVPCLDAQIVHEQVVFSAIRLGGHTRTPEAGAVI